MLISFPPYSAHPKATCSRDQSPTRRCHLLRPVGSLGSGFVCTVVEEMYQMFLKKETTIRAELSRLVIGCVLPVWLIAAYLIHYAYNAKVDEVKRIMLDSAQLTTMIVDRELATIKATLQTLATSPAFTENDLPLLYRQCLEIRAGYPGAELVIADSSCQQLINTFRPLGSHLPKGNNYLAVKRVFLTRQPVVSDLFLGALTGRHLLAIDVPVVRNGKVIYDLSMIFTPERLSSILRQQRLPAGWYTAIIDKQMLLVARSHDQDRYVSRPAGPRLRSAMLGAPSGTLELVNLAGIPAFVSYCRSSVSGWTVLAGVPKSTLMTDAYRWAIWGTVVATAISLLSIALAGRSWRRIASSIRSLVPPAIAIGCGGAVRAAGNQPIKETAEVSRALAEASNLIQSQILTVREQQQRLRQANELLEHRVAERTADLEAAMREQESFSYTVSHDLRAPLRHLNSYCTILAEDHGRELSPEGRLYLERISSAADKMGRLIDNLLELSKITKAPLQPKIVDLSEVATSILSAFRETEPQRDMSLVIEQGVKVHGDPVLLEQLLQNLLANAWKYTSKLQSACIEFGSTSAAGEAVYFIKDDGVGFDMAYRDKLFKAFERLHGEEFEGLGIGLATAQRVVERHGGRIWADGKVGAGATIYFSIPAAGDC